MPGPVGSWLLPAGTVSLAGSRGRAGPSDESAIFFLFKSHPLSCDIGTERCVLFAVSAASSQRKKRWTGELKGRATQTAFS